MGHRGPPQAPARDESYGWQQTLAAAALRHRAMTSRIKYMDPRRTQLSQSK